jgi:type I restriction enzyme M protein
MNKPDIDFEKELWDAANELRGAVAENEYKNYVLSLIFLKYVSERFETRREQLSFMVKEPESPYYTKSQKERDYVMNDPDEYLSHNTFIIPETATWTYLRNHAGDDDIRVKVDDAFSSVEDVLSKYRDDLKGILPRLFVKSQLSAKQVAGMIDLFSKKKFSEKENPESDILGRIYEYYLGKFAMAEGAGAGQFFTPGSIVRLLVEMLEPYQGRIFDPACGSGGMFVQSMKFVNSHNGGSKNISIYGQERYEGTLRLCKMNLFLRGLSFDIRLGDSLLNDRFPDLKADFVISNPPFNVKQWHPEDLQDEDPRLLGPKDEFTNTNANYMWMQTFYSHLSKSGTAGFVMANGAMTTNTSGERNVREFMVDNGIIDCIVRLPDKLFLTTGIPACLFFLSKNRDGKDGKHRERKNEILFIDANKMGEMVTRRQRILTDEDIDKITSAYHNWRNTKGIYSDIEGFCKSATIDEVKAQDYKLTPGIYVGTEVEQDDGIPFEEKMDELKEKLMEQFAKSNELQNKIIENLREF